MNTEATTITVVAEGLLAPEGPICLPDGDVIVSEMLGAAVTRVHPDGSRTKIAHVPGTPNGLAFGPDGGLYCANMGGFAEAVAEVFPQAHPDALGYRGGSLQRIDVATGEVTTLCTHTADGRPLLMPDDLVFDTAGGCYFTDLGRLSVIGEVHDVTGIYYWAPGDTTARKVADSQFATNGIGLSADGTRLWWTEYHSGRLLAQDVVAPGELRPPDRRHGDVVYVHAAPVTYFDSLTVMADGGVTVAVHDGTATGKSGIMSFDADGRETGFVRIDDAVVTHIAFGGPDLTTGFVTLAGSGKLVRVEWPVAGLAPLFGPGGRT